MYVQVEWIYRSFDCEFSALKNLFCGSFFMPNVPLDKTVGQRAF